MDRLLLEMIVAYGLLQGRVWITNREFIKSQFITFYGTVFKQFIDSFIKHLLTALGPE